jgi:hypothetical protein
MISDKYKSILIDKFGDDIGEQIIGFLIENPINLEVKALLESIELPRIEIIFEPNEGSPQRVYQFYVKVNGVTQRFLKSISIPKLEYSNNELLVLNMEYFCIEEPLSESECQEFVDNMIEELDEQSE